MEDEIPPTVEPTWSVVENFVEGKSADAMCEDLIVVTADFAVVVDGASDSTGLRIDGQTGGRFAAEILRRSIECLPAAATAREFADRLTGDLADRVHEAAGDLGPSQRWPSASVVCMSFARREIWRIGDCNVVIDGRPDVGGKRVDDAAYGFRAAYNAALLAAGTPLADILRDDPGAAASRPLLDSQQHLANVAGPWGYGCINGRPVPDELIEVQAVAPRVGEVVLTSDGYPDPQPSLAASEERLQQLLAADPAAIGALWTVGKSLRPGNRSVDDRAFLRLRQAATP